MVEQFALDLFTSCLCLGSHDLHSQCQAREYLRISYIRERSWGLLCPKPVLEDGIHPETLVFFLVPISVCITRGVEGHHRWLIRHESLRWGLRIGKEQPPPTQKPPEQESLNNEDMTVGRRTCGDSLCSKCAGLKFFKSQDSRNSPNDLCGTRNAGRRESESNSSTASALGTAGLS